MLIVVTWTLLRSSCSDRASGGTRQHVSVRDHADNPAAKIRLSHRRLSNQWPAQWPHGRVGLFRVHQLAEITLEHVALEALGITLDPIDAIDCAELFRHLPYNP